MEPDNASNDAKDKPESTEDNETKEDKPESTQDNARDNHDDEQEVKSDGDKTPPSSSPAKADTPRGAAWGAPLARFDRGWTWLEIRLLTFVLVWQLVALVAWVLLGGLAAPPSSTNAAGMVFRAVVGAVLLATACWFGLKRQRLLTRQIAAMIGLVVGAALAPLWREVGITYFDNIRGWLQEGSTLTLMGGLRGLGTRLTLWLALLGASVATAAGKHIHVDLLFRLLPKKARLPASMVNSCAAALVCLAGVWGFFDHIAIESFGAKADDTASAKISRVYHESTDHLFLVRKQIGLDLRTLPRVIAGSRYDTWMTASSWNTWVKEAGFEQRYPGEDISRYMIPEDAQGHLPLVVSPDGEPVRGILVHDLSLVFPFGLLMIGIRFLLRAILTLSGHISVDPDEAHREQDLHRATDTKEQTAGGA